MARLHQTKQSPGTQAAPLRWTVAMGAREFDIDRRTLAGNLAQAGALPGRDGRYRTLDIVAGVFGDVQHARQRLIQVQAQRIELEIERSRETLMEHSDVVAFHAGIFTTLRRIIQASKLSELEKSEIDKELGRGMGA
jgi:hypothetical protein